MKDRAALFAVLALAFAWGYNWIVIKVALGDASPLAVSAIRLTLGCVALFAVVAIARKPLRSPPVWQTIGLALVQTAALSLLQAFALATGGAGKTTVLVYTMPFWLVIFATVFLHERLTRQRAFAVTLAAIGLGFVLVPLDFGHGLLSKIFALGAATCWGLGSVFTKAFRERYDVDLLTFSAWQTLYAAIPLVLIALIVPGGSRMHVTPSFLIAMTYTTLIGTALAFWLWFFIIERLPASVAGLSSLLAPVVSVLAAWLQLHERPSGTEMIGILFILSALIVNTIPREALPAWAQPASRPR